MQVGSLQPAHLILPALVLFTEVAVVVVHLVDGFAAVVVVDLVHLVLPLSSPVLSPLSARVRRVAVVPVVAVGVVVGVAGGVVVVRRRPRNPKLGLVADRPSVLQLLGWNRGRTFSVGEVRGCWRLRLALLLLLHLNIFVCKT